MHPLPRICQIPDSEGKQVLKHLAWTNGGGPEPLFSEREQWECSQTAAQGWQRRAESGLLFPCAHCAPDGTFYLISRSSAPHLFSMLVPRAIQSCFVKEVCPGAPEGLS